MTTPAGPSAFDEPHLSTAAENTGGGLRARAVLAPRQIVKWACGILAVSAPAVVAALTRAVLALPQIFAWICWFVAVIALVLSVGALFWWPGVIGETTSKWMLDSAVLLVSTGVFVKTIHGGKLWRHAAPLIVSLVALFASHPALAAWAGQPLAVISSFVFTGIAIFSLVVVARRRSVSVA